MKTLKMIEQITVQTEQLYYMLQEKGYNPSTEIQVDPLRISIDITDYLYVVNYETTIEVFYAPNDKGFRLIRIFDKTKNTPNQVLLEILALLNI